MNQWQNKYNFWLFENVECECIKHNLLTMYKCDQKTFSNVRKSDVEPRMRLVSFTSTVFAFVSALAL